MHAKQGNTHKQAAELLSEETVDSTLASLSGSQVKWEMRCEESVWSAVLEVGARRFSAKSSSEEEARNKAASDAIMYFSLSTQHRLRRVSSAASEMTAKSCSYVWGLAKKVLNALVHALVGNTPMSELNEFLQRHAHPAAVYVHTKEGPDNEPSFTVSSCVFGHRVTETGARGTRLDAVKHSVAAALLRALNSDTVDSDVRPPTEEELSGQLDGSISVMLSERLRPIDLLSAGCSVTADDIEPSDSLLEALCNSVRVTSPAFGTAYISVMVNQALVGRDTPFRMNPQRVPPGREAPRWKNCSMRLHLDDGYRPVPTRGVVSMWKSEDITVWIHRDGAQLLAFIERFWFLSDEDRNRLAHALNGNVITASSAGGTCFCTSMTKQIVTTSAAKDGYYVIAQNIDGVVEGLGAHRFTLKPTLVTTPLNWALVVTAGKYLPNLGKLVDYEMGMTTAPANTKTWTAHPIIHLDDRVRSVTSCLSTVLGGTLAEPTFMINDAPDPNDGSVVTYDQPGYTGFI